MDSKLKDLYYDSKTGLTGFAKFWYRVQKVLPDATKDQVKQFYDKQEIGQILKKPILKKNAMLKITGPPLSFQVDVMFLPKYLATKNSNLGKLLTFIDIISRKAYAYPMKTQTGEEIVEGYKTFLKDLKNDLDKLKGTYDEYAIDKPISLTSDKGFDFAEFNKLNEKLKIPLDTQTAKDDHVSAGNRLGIIDTFTRTFKTIINRVIHGNNDLKVMDQVPSILQNYNSSIHSSLAKHTPNEVFESKDLRYYIMSEQMNTNKSILKTRFKLKPGDTVRGVKAKEVFDKEGPRFTKKIYIIDSQVGNKYKIKDKDGTVKQKLYKLHELLPVDEAEVETRPKQEEAKQEIKEAKQEQKTKRVLSREGIEPVPVLERAKRSRKPSAKLIEQAQS